MATTGLITPIQWNCPLARRHQPYDCCSQLARTIVGADPLPLQSHLQGLSACGEKTNMQL